MSSVVDELEARIRQLSDPEREELLARLQGDPDIERAWIAEAERRLASDEPSIPAEEVFARLDRRLAGLR